MPACRQYTHGMHKCEISLADLSTIVWFCVFVCSVCSLCVPCWPVPPAFFCIFLFGVFVLTCVRGFVSLPVLGTGEPQARHHLHDHQDGLPVHVRHSLRQGSLPREDQRADHLRHHHAGAVCVLVHTSNCCDGMITAAIDSDIIPLCDGLRRR